MSAPNIRSLAKITGFSISTVSEALRNSPKVKPATREMIRKAAQKAGYRPNPLVGAVMSEIRHASHQGYRGTIAAINYAETDPPQMPPFHREIFAGAQARGQELGYNLELFWVGGRGISLKRLDGILQSRGVQGVLVLPFRETRDFSDLTWPHYSAVCMDYCVSRPHLNIVCPDHHLGLLQLLGRITAAGHRRIGLFLENHRDERIFRKWSSAFLGWQQSLPARERVPIYHANEIERGPFLRWFQKHRPTAVVGHVTEAVSWLREAGFAVPGDVAFATLNWNLRSVDCAGLDLHPRLCGEAAIEMVIAQITRNERGAPAHPRTLTTEIVWQDGPTLAPARD